MKLKRSVMTKNVANSPSCIKYLVKNPDAAASSNTMSALVASKRMIINNFEVIRTLKGF